MSVELWLGIGHYLLGVLVIFALVVALMETSRKFDRFHDNSYLLLATGYFLLVVWALIRAIAIGPSLLQMIAVVCLVLGLLCLAFGYYFHHRAHPLENDDEAQPKEAAAGTKKTPKVALKEDWMKMLSADEEMAEPETEPESEPEAEPEVLPADNPVEEKPEEVKEEKAEDVPAEPIKTKKPKAIKSVEPAGEVDLSYLANRSKKKVKPASVEPAPIPPPLAATTPEPIVAPVVTATKTEEKKPKASKKKETPVKEEVKETREEILDDLFPLAHQTKKKKMTVNPLDTDILPGEGLHDAK